MVIEFDPVKDARNRQDHGISLAEFARMDLDAMVATNVIRHGEARTLVMAPIDGRVYFAVITFRGAAVRPISLRKANPREVRKYEAARAR